MCGGGALSEMIRTKVRLWSPEAQREGVCLDASHQSLDLPWHLELVNVVDVHQQLHLDHP